ncbi:unnamed protein product [Gongylonema pulchrum]|uniref:SICA antigen n=1 Tax=Gongylonema pulchrum TaxID=637853 RepID=A0A183E1F8_9BILA|nr:unnamed protein product [Gongylonema pulchrum]
MKHDGKSASEILERIIGYMDNLSSDSKCHAVDALHEGCRELLKYVLGDEAYAEVKKLKESGLAIEELKNKVDAMLKDVKDERKKGKIEHYGPGCRKVVTMALQHEGHNHHDVPSLKHCLETHLKWLSSSQKAELINMKSGGKSNVQLIEKVMHYYEKEEGDEKDQATEMLMEGCRELFIEIVGNEKYIELRNLKDFGAKLEELKEKVLVMVGEGKDGEKKKQFEEVKSLCFVAAENWHKKHHGELSRRVLEDYLKTDLSWLTEEQKNEMRKMKKEGKSLSDREHKVLEYLGKLHGEKKHRAVEQILGGCQLLLKNVVGEQKAAELKKMRDSGATVEELFKKIDADFGEVTDNHKKEKIKEFGAPCRKAFELAQEQKNHGIRSLEYYFEHQLKWLTEEEKKELKHLEEERKTWTEMQDKVLQYYRSATGSVKKEATELLGRSCNDFLARTFGEEKAKELQEMKESGKKFGEIDKKLNQTFEGVEDMQQKEEFKLYQRGCREIYKYGFQHSNETTGGTRFKRNMLRQVAEAVTRQMRSHYENPLDSYFTRRLKRLVPMQQEEQRKIKDAGESTF